MNGIKEGEFKELYGFVDGICAKLGGGEAAQNFRKCYLNTLETTVKFDDNGGAFVITGDIEAMWLRDSSVQVSHYVRLAGRDADVDRLVRSLLKRQFESILLDPYANAFNESANGRGHDDITKRNDSVWERKYEIDSLIYPLWLLNKYYFYTGNAAAFDSLFFRALATIIDTLVREQDYAKHSDYSFIRTFDGAKDSLDNGGKGGDYKFTGMVRSAFRPSDDKCKYSFLVPSNMFIVAALRELCGNLSKAQLSNPIEGAIMKLCGEIEKGIEDYAVVDVPEFGKIYAFEVDGLGASLLMDDANVPSLLSLPYLGYCKKDDEIYMNTRKFILSKANPYYFEGKCARGIGSPHTPAGYIWHIGLIMEALTAADRETVERIEGYLKSTTAGTGFMHEGFNCDNADEFTRSWFAWANTLYAIFVLDCVIK